MKILIVVLLVSISSCSVIYVRAAGDVNVNKNKNYETSTYKEIQGQSGAKHRIIDGIRKRFSDIRVHDDGARMEK